MAEQREGLKSPPLLERALRGLGPDYALVLCSYFGQAFVIEFLDSLAAEGFAGEDISFGVGGDAVDRVEFAGLAAAVAETGQHFHRLAIENVNCVVRAI